MCLANCIFAWNKHVLFSNWCSWYKRDMMGMYFSNWRPNSKRWLHVAKLGGKVVLVRWKNNLLNRLVIPSTTQSFMFFLRWCRRIVASVFTAFICTDRHAELIYQYVIVCCFSLSGSSSTVMGQPLGVPCFILTVMRYYGIIIFKKTKQYDCIKYILYI